MPAYKNWPFIFFNLEINMRTCLFLSLLLSFLSSYAFAFDVKCYSSGQLFYHKKVRNLFVGEGFIINKDNKFREIVMADCMIRYKPALKKKARQ